MQFSGLQVYAPGKVNLSLKVVGTLPSGLHLIDSVVVQVSLYDVLIVDELRIGVSEPDFEIRVETDRPSVPDGPANLVFRAAQAFASRTQESILFKARIRKTIPSGAGLGGGSSDAAATLRLLNRASGERLSETELESLASTIGADVPLFLTVGPKRVCGVGEILVAYDAPVPRHLVLCSDGTELSTAAVYREYDDALTRPVGQSRKPDSVVAMADAIESSNDLEDAATALHPGIRLVRVELLRRGGREVAMTGSGSVVFGAFQAKAEAIRVAAELRSDSFWAQAVETLG